MSGGSMDYISYRIEEYSEDLCDLELADLAKDMAKVYHDAEWWHSGDICEETYRKTVAKFKKKWFGSDRELRLKGYVTEIFDGAYKECLRLIGEKVPGND